MIYAGAVAVLAFIVYVFTLRRRALRAESRAADQERRAEVSEATAQANATADRRETSARVEADAAIPSPVDAGWGAVGEIDAAARDAEARRGRR